MGVKHADVVEARRNPSDEPVRQCLPLLRSENSEQIGIAPPISMSGVAHGVFEFPVCFGVVNPGSIMGSGRHENLVSSVRQSDNAA